MLKTFLKNFAVISLSLLLANPCWAGINFDGADDFFAKQNTNTGFPTGTWTILAWIYPSIIDGTIFDWGERYGTATGFRFRLNSSGSELQATTWGIKDYITTTFTIVTTEFQFVAAVFDSSFDVTFYHYLPSTDTWTIETIAHNVDQNNPGTDADIIIGFAHGNLTNDLSALTSPYGGIIGELKLYGSAFSISQIYNECLSMLKFYSENWGNLNLYYHLDDQTAGTSADGDTVRDLSGNGNNGTGDDGANGTGLQWIGESILSYSTQPIGMK